VEETQKLEQGIETDEVSIEAREAIVMVMDGATTYRKLEEMIQTDSMDFARRGMNRLFDRYLIDQMPGIELADEKIWANVAPYLDAVPANQKTVLADFHAARNYVKGLAQKSVSLIQMSPTATRRAIRNRQNVTEEV